MEGSEPPAPEPADVGAACDRFEAALREAPAGRLPRVEEHFPGARDAPDALLGELLLLECEYRFRAGDQVTIEELSARLPGRPEFLAGVLAAARGHADPQADTALRFPDGAPAVVGRYRLVRELGRGGFGTVFLARHIDRGTEVALKVPHAAVLVTPALRHRFVREAEAVAAIDHPNIVRVVEAGADGPVTYLATRYVPGVTLAEWLTGRGANPVEPRAAAALVLALAGAIEHAHARGVLHCDLKPSNILLAEHDPARPVVTDFGIARLAGTAEQTPTGHVLGTPAYMAPEQAAGNRSAASPRTDVYGLGAILYELLTGRPPVEARSLADALVQILRGYPPRPRSLRRRVPRDLEAVCLACLEKDPVDRYASAADLAAELRRCLDGQRTLARPPGPLGAVRTWVRRNPGAAGAAAAVFLALALTATGLGWHATVLGAANRELAAAVTERDTANSELRTERDVALDRERVLRRRAYPDELARARSLLVHRDPDGCRELLAGLAPLSGQEELRGFEWHHLDALARPTPHETRLRAAEPVYAVAVRPDGGLVAVGTAKGLRLLDPLTGNDAFPPAPHPADVNRVVFAPSGRSFATACDDGVVRFWREAGAAPRELRGHEGKVTGLAFAPDGRVASAGRDRTVRVWDPNAAGPPGRVLVTTTTPLRAVAWSPDGRFVATGEDGDAQGEVRVWDAGGALVAAFSENARAACGLAFTPAGRLVSALRDGRVIVYQPAAEGGRWAVVTRFGTEHDRITDLALSPDGGLATVVRDDAIEVWDAGTGELETAFRGRPGRIWAAAFAPDGRRVWSGEADGSVRVWDRSAPRPLARRRIPDPGLYTLAFAPDGRRLAAGTGTALHVLDPGSGQLASAVSRELPQNTIAGAFVPDGRLCFVQDDGSLFRGRPGEPFVRLARLVRGTARELPPSLVALSPNGSWAVGSDGPELSVCGPAGAPHAPIRPGAAVESLAVTDRGRIATACTDKTVRVWDAAGRFEVALTCGRESPQVVAVAPDGRWVAAGCGAVALVWDVSRPEPAARLVGHRGSVRAVTFSPDGGTVATGGADGTVRLWRAATGTPVAVYDEHTGQVRRVVFSPDGLRLASSASPDRHTAGAEIIVRNGGRPDP